LKTERSQENKSIHLKLENPYANVPKAQKRREKR